MLVPKEKPSAAAGPYSRPWDIERCNDMSPPEGRHLLHAKSLCCKFQTLICMLAPATVLGDELDRFVLGNRLASRCSPTLAKFGWMTGCMVGGWWRLMGLGGTEGYKYSDRPAPQLSARSKHPARNNVSKLLGAY